MEPGRSAAQQRKQQGKRKANDDDEPPGPTQLSNQRMPANSPRRNQWVSSSSQGLPSQLSHGRNVGAVPSGITTPAREPSENAEVSKIEHGDRRVFPATGALRQPGSSTRRLSNIPDLPEPGPSATPRRQSQMRSASEQVAIPSGGMREGRNLTAEEAARTLPRRFNSALLQSDPADRRRPSLPVSFVSQALPNPHGKGRSQREVPRENQWETLLHAQPALPTRSPSAEIPHTPPLNVPTTTPTFSPPRRALPEIPQPSQKATVSLQEPKEELEEQSRWSSGESTPTPTASSVAAASARRAEEAKELVPVPLFAPVQSKQPTEKTGEVQQQAQVQVRHLGKTEQTTSQAPSSEEPKKPFADPTAASERPLSTDSSVLLPDGREIRTVRTDFDKMKRFSRPSSSSQPSSMPENLQRTITEGHRDDNRSSLDHSVSVGPHSAPTQAETTPASKGKAHIEAPSIDQILRMANQGTRATAAPIVKGLREKNGVAQKETFPTSHKVASPPASARMPSDDKRRAEGREGQDRTRSPLPMKSKVPDAPVLQQALRFNRSDPSLATPESSKPGTGTQTNGGNGKSARDDLAASAQSNAQVADRNTFGPSASVFEQADQILRHVQEQQKRREATAAAASTRRLPGRRSSQEEEDGGQNASHERDFSGSNRIRKLSNAASLRRSSFGSGTTALDTPNIEQRDSTDVYGNVNQKDKRASSSMEEERQGLVHQPRRGLVSGLAAPPSDVPEVREPSLSGTAESRRGSRGRQQPEEEDSSYHGPVQQLVINTGETQDGHGDEKASHNVRVIPIANATRPYSAGILRPGTGQTRFSTRSFRTRRLPSGHGNAPACRQCFRAGFDCAMNLQLGEGTAGRKAFQDFVNSGGLDAISIRDAGDDRGSVTVSQALGRNYVDKLGDVAFGESALSRPVTRGAVNDMLEERGRVLAEQQRKMSVENFLTSLQRAKWEQDEEDDRMEREKEIERVGSERERASNRPDSIRTRSKTVSQREAPRSSTLTRPWAATASEARRANMVDQDVGSQFAYEIDPDDYASDAEGPPSTSTSSDDLGFLADRWTTWRKVAQLLVVCVWIFIIQTQDSGYDTSLPAISSDFRTMPYSLATGRLAYLWGEGGGFLFGASTMVIGRHRPAIFSVMFAGGASVIAGFAQSAVLLTTMRGLSGFAGGVFQIAALGIAMDLTTSILSRCAALTLFTALVIAGQAAGPWIASLVMDVGSWHWLYWMVTVTSVIYSCVFGICCSETAPEVVYRHKVRDNRNSKSPIWMAEPRKLPRVRYFIRFYIILPYLVLLTHPAVGIAGLLLAVLWGSTVLAIAGLPSVLTDAHHMSDHLAKVMITVCVALGFLIAAFVVFTSLRYRSRRNSKQKVLFVDEKGYIDTTRPSHDAEQVLRLGIIAVPAGVIALYTLALTASSTNWIFSALSIVVLSASDIILSLSVVMYLFETYYPAATSVLGEVISFSDDHGPAPLMGARGGGRRRSSSASDTSSTATLADENEHTLKSGGDEDGKRWPTIWALLAIAGLLNNALFISGLMTFVSHFALNGLRYQVLVIILASSCLAAYSLNILLLRFGRKMRRIAFRRIARKEQSMWLKMRHSSAPSPPRTPRTGSFEMVTGPSQDVEERLSPAERQNEQDRGQMQTGSGARSKLRQLLLPARQLWKPQEGDTRSRERTLDISTPMLQETDWTMENGVPVGPSTPVTPRKPPPEDPSPSRKNKSGPERKSPSQKGRGSDQLRHGLNAAASSAPSQKREEVSQIARPVQATTSPNDSRKWQRRHERQMSMGGIDISPQRDHNVSRNKVRR